MNSNLLRLQKLLTGILSVLPIYIPWVHTYIYIYVPIVSA